MLALKTQISHYELWARANPYNARLGLSIMGSTMPAMWGCCEKLSVSDLDSLFHGALCTRIQNGQEKRNLPPGSGD